jgi:hypothetical protein
MTGVRKCCSLICHIDLIKQTKLFIKTDHVYQCHLISIKQTKLLIKTGHVYQCHLISIKQNTEQIKLYDLDLIKETIIMMFMLSWRDEVSDI